MTANESAAAELQGLVTRLNDAWLGRRFGELNALFHPDALMVVPDLSTRIVGRGVCVASYREFVLSATVHAFRTAPAEVDIVGRVAMVLVPYEVDYENDSERWQGTGRDVLVFRKLADEWVVGWRLMVPGDETLVERTAGS